MKSQHQLEFITAKIQDLQTAVLHNCSNYVLNIPSGVVNTLHIDETGCVWFAIYRPSQLITEFERRFPVTLNYYQKGKPFFLNIQGMARIVIDPEEINSLPENVGNAAGANQMLICVKIISASYHETKVPRTAAKKTLLYQLKNSLLSVFSINNTFHIHLDRQQYVA